MQDDPKSKKSLSSLAALREVLDERLEDEGAVLDALVVALGKGERDPLVWEKLHAAAQRDDRLSELAFAYEALGRDKRLRVLPGAVQAELLLQAGRFFSEVFGDPEGAEGYLERAVAASPGHPEAFSRLEALLLARHEGVRLAELYVSTAAAVQPADREPLVSRALELVLSLSMEDESAERLLLAMRATHASQAGVQEALEAHYERCGRPLELARLLEAGLEGALEADEANEARTHARRERLVALYATELGEVERALPHAEAVLRRDAGSEVALGACERLLAQKAQRPRAAAALEAAYAELGRDEGSADMLAIQLETARGPKRIEVQRRLANLLYDKLGDLAGAFSNYEAVVAAEPADDDSRHRFEALAASLDKRDVAARVLTRALAGAKDPVQRTRLSTELGELFVDMGDPKRAQRAFQSALEAGGDDAMVLRAARNLAEIHAESREPRALAAVLERLSEAEPTPEARAARALELADLCERELRDPAGAVRALRKLLGSPLEDEALARLEAAYEATESHAELAEVLERRGEREPDAAEARALALRAAEIRATRTRDRAAAIAAFRRILAAFGADREVHERLAPLLEQERRWEELGALFEADAELAPEAERPAALHRVAALRQTRLGDLPGALAAYGAALAIDPDDRVARASVEKIAVAGEHRLDAADVLEPILRAAGDHAGLLRLLEVRAALSPGRGARLAALEEAAAIAAGPLGDPKRAASALAAALKEAAEGAPDAIEPLAGRLDALPPAGADKVRRAAVFADAFDALGAPHPAGLSLARRAGEALVQAGDVTRALKVYRRALELDPSSSELLARVDALLREQGNPAERIALYRSALAQPCEPERRRELRLAIAAIERRDLGDLEAAAATYRAALAEDPSDPEVFEGLLEALRASGQHAALYAALRDAAEGRAGADRASALVGMVEAALLAGTEALAVEHARELLAIPEAEIPDSALLAIEALAERSDDPELLRASLEFRVNAGAEPEREALLLERLGEVYAERLGDPAAAVLSFMQAARSLEETDAGAERAAALYERVLGLSPAHRDAAERLVELYRRLGAFAKIPGPYAVLLADAGGAAEATPLVLAFEEPAIRGGATEAFVAAARRLLEDPGAAPREGAIRAALARVLAADPARQDEAAEAFRALLAGAPGDASEEIAAFEAFLAAGEALRAEDRRWVFAFRLERAPEEERPRLLLAFAEMEEKTLGDFERAGRLYDELLALDEGHAAALEARTRILLLRGDLEGAAAALRERRDHSEGEARLERGLELAALLFERLGRPELALEPLAEVLDAAPGDARALELAAALLRVEASQDGAARLLERAESAAEEPSAAAAILELLLAAPPLGEAQREARIGYLERRLEAEPSAEAALALALAATRELPLALPLWDRAEVLARELGRAEAVAAAYREALEAALPLAGGAGEADVSARELALEELGRRALAFQEEWFDDQAQVASLLERIVALSPGASWAFERLKLVYNATERWEELFALYDRMLARSDALAASGAPDAASAAERRDLLRDAALAAKDLANRPELAIRYLEELLTLRRDARTLSTLERLYERAGRFRELAGVLGMQLEALSGEAAARHRARIAALWLEPLGEPDRALAVVLAMLEEDADSAVAFELLERIAFAEATEPPPESREGARLRAAGLLEARYRKEARPAELARALDVLLEAPAEPSEQRARLRELVALRRDRPGERSRAFDALAALVALEPEDEALRADLARMAGQLGDEPRLADVLVEVGEQCEDEALRARLLMSALVVCRDALDQIDRAVSLGKRILELSPGPEATLEAARVTDALLAAAGRIAERPDVLERLASLEPSAGARVDALGELARIAASTGELERSVSAYRARLQIREGDLEALDGLADVLERLQKPADLAAVLRARAAARPDSAREDLVRVARLEERELGDARAAISTWLEIRRGLGPDDESADALVELYLGLGDDAALVAILEEAERLAADAARKLELLCRLGDVHRTRTADLAAATSAYAAALRLDPTDAGAARGLEEIAHRLLAASSDAGPPEALARATEALRVAYVETDDFERTIALLDARLASSALSSAPSPAIGQAAVLLETAALLERRALDPGRAYDAAWRAFLVRPEMDVADEVTRLAEIAGRFGDLAEALGPALSARPPADAAVGRELLVRLGRWQHARGDLEAAEACFERALGFAPEDEALLVAIVELRRPARRRPLVDALLRLAAATGDDVGLMREAAEVALGALSDLPLAESIADRMLTEVEARWGASPTAAVEPAEADHGRFAVEVLSRGREAAGDAPGVVRARLRGAALPFAGAERRALRARAAEAADRETAVSLYEGLFSEEPTDPLVQARLEALYGEAGMEGAMLSLRERQIEVERDPGRRLALRSHAADLLVRMEARPRAIAFLRKNLAESPVHETSLGGLAELLSAEGMFAELCALWEEQGRLREASGDPAAGAFFGRAAALAERELGDVRRAIADHRRAAALGGEAAAASLEALATLHTARGEHALAAEVLERICEAAGEADAEACVLRLADACVAAGERTRATERLEAFAARERGAARVRERLAALYRDAGAFGPLADLVAAQAELCPDVPTRLLRLREAAELHLTHRDDPASAVPLLERAASLAPSDLSVRLTLAAALTRAGRVDAAAALLRQILAGFGPRRPKERALVHHELARVLLTSGDRPGALGELDAALKIDPAHPGILDALARLAFEAGQLDRAQTTYRALLLVLRRPGSSSALGPAPGPASGSVLDGASRISRSQVLFELSRIALARGEDDRTEEYIETAFEAAREADAERIAFSQALRAAGRFDLLARLLEQSLQAPPPSGSPGLALTGRAAILAELARVYDEHLGRTVAALEALLSALRLDPRDARCHDAALAIARRLGRVPAYLEVVEACLAEAPAPEDRVALLLLLAGARESVLGDLPGAAAALGRAEALLEEVGEARAEAGALEAVERALDRVREAMGDVDGRAKLLEKRAARAAEKGRVSDQAAALFELAALLLGAPGEASDAAAELVLGQAMELAPDPARLERIVRAAIEVGARPVRAVRLLEGVARESGDPGLRPALAFSIIWLAEEGAAPVSSLREAEALARELGDDALRERVLRTGLARAEAEPTSVRPSVEWQELAARTSELAWALVALAELREAAGDLEEAASLRERASGVVDAGEARVLLLSVAGLAAGPLEQLERAAAIYERLRAREPADRDLWEPLLDVYRRLGDEARLAALIDATVPLIDEGAERSRYRLERARLAEKSSPEDVVRLLHEILEEDPSQVEAALMLSQTLEREGRTAELAELLAMQLDAAKGREDLQSVVSLSMRLASLLELQGDDAGAQGVYLAALDWDPKCREALRAIVRLVDKRDEPLDLDGALERLLEVEEGEAAASVARRLAELRRAAWDEEGALAALEAGFEACPTDDALQAELAQRLTSAASWARLARLHAREAEARSRPEEKVDKLRLAADVLRQREHDARGAAELLERALSFVPGDRLALGALVEACAEIGDPARAAAALSAALEAQPEDAWLFQARARLAGASGDLEGAARDFERAYALSGGEAPEELAGALEAWLASMLGAALEVSDEDLSGALAPFDPEIGPGSAPPGVPPPQTLAAPGEIPLRLRLAEVRARLGDEAGSRLHLSEILRRDPKHRDALRALAELEASAGRHDAAGAAYRRLIALEEGESLVAVALKLADACERAGRLADARGGLERALRLAPGDLAVRDRLRTVYNVTGASRELAKMTLEDAAVAADVEGRFVLLVRAGRLLLASEDGAAEAAPVLEEARGLKPEDEGARMLLAEIYGASGRLAEARALLAAAIAAHKGRRSPRLAALHHAAGLLERRAGDERAYYACLSRAFETDPSDAVRAMELGVEALGKGDHDVATRAFRSITLTKAAPGETPDSGRAAASRALAYYHLGRIAEAQGDRRRARLMVEKAVQEDPSLAEARALLDVLRSS